MWLGEGEEQENKSMMTKWEKEVRKRDTKGG